MYPVTEKTRGATWGHRGASKVPRPTGSIASDVCDCILSWVARKTCWVVLVRAHHSRAERAEPWEGESSIEDGKR